MWFVNLEARPCVTRTVSKRMERDAFSRGPPFCVPHGVLPVLAVTVLPVLRTWDQEPLLPGW